jgi:hypothetical protein
VKAKNTGSKSRKKYEYAHPAGPGLMQTADWTAWSQHRYEFPGATGITNVILAVEDWSSTWSPSAAVQILMILVGPLVKARKNWRLACSIRPGSMSSAGPSAGLKVLGSSWTSIGASGTNSSTVMKRSAWAEP